LSGSRAATLVSRELVERQGGTIEATSDGVGRGSSIRIRLPLARRQ
jgi:signal transduction histidine kinase